MDSALKFAIELHHAVTLRVLDQVGEDQAALFQAARRLQYGAQAVAVEDVVSEHQADVVVADELLADEEGLGQPLGPGLLAVGQVQTELRAIAQKLLEIGQVVRGGNDQDVPDIRQHQGGQGIIDHRLVVDGQQLLADNPGKGMEPGAGAPREDDAFHICL